MTQLLVIPETVLRAVQEAIVNATHTATNALGEKIQISTIDSRTLAAAARVAIELATGEVVWPGGEKLRIPKPKQQMGILEEV